MSRRTAVGPTPGRGATLIEVAVALLLISIGALGLAGLQVTAKQLGHQADQRGQAAALAMAMLESIRANRGVPADYAVAGAGAARGPADHAPERDCSQAACDPGQLRTWDLWQWTRALRGSDSPGNGGLAGAAGCIGVAGRRVTVVVAWQVPGVAPDPNADPGCAGSPAPGREWRSLQLATFISRE